MLPDDVTARIGALREADEDTEIGFHGHHNMAMGIANSLAAIEAGADRIDGSAAGLGAGAGNTPWKCSTRCWTEWVLKQAWTYSS